MATKPFLFDPNSSKVVNSYGGYDSNEKGLVQYPKADKFEISSVGNVIVRRPSSSYPCCCSGDEDKTYSEGVNHERVFRNPILDPVTRHYRRFMQDPSRIKDAEKQVKDSIQQDDQERKQKLQPASCGTPKHRTTRSSSSFPTLRQKPIDPIHWKPNLFDTRYEKYYLTNLLNENPYRDFLTDCAEATTPQHYCSEYRQSFPGNPVVPSPSSGKIIGLGRPTDLTEPCDWRRNQTRKLRDVIFTHEKDSLDSNLDYKDPKRYNPWPRLRMGYAQMVEGNYRPRPHSGVEYNVTTLLPAVSPHSKQWLV